MKIFNGMVFGFLVCFMMHGMDDQNDKTALIARLQQERSIIVAENSISDRQQTSRLIEIDKEIYNINNGVTRRSKNQNDQ